MGIVIGCEKVRVEYPTRIVFEELTLGINTGQRIGIVGQNGCGKSTLLRVLNRECEIDAGRVVHTHGVSIGVLGQSDALCDNDTVKAAIVGDTPEYVWASNAHTREILSALVGDVSWNARVGALSGGQRRRVDLARLLIGDWDVLMLDEPTNHLDMSTIAWLVNHLKHRWRARQGTLLVVTHDRWFLDEVATSMWEVHAGGVEAFEGGFSAYIMQRVERQRAAAVAEQKRQNQLRRELAWLSRGARARATKPKFHVKVAQQLIEDVPPLRDTLELKRMAMSRLGKQVVDLDGVSVEFAGGANAGVAGDERNEGADDGHDTRNARTQALNNSPALSPALASAPGAGAQDSALHPESRTVLDNITWMIGPGDRFGIIGENGAGKTTLLNVIQGIQKPTRGRVKIGKTVKFAVLSQHLDSLHAHDGERVRDVIGQYSHRIMLDGKEATPAQLLGNLGFTRADLNEVVGSLSGGQARRLSLMLILLDEPNVLILDEPGNDLDVDMLAQVESLLDGWPGTLLLVTHDRYLMERVTDHQFALIDGSLRHLPGGVDEYVQIVGAGTGAKAKVGAEVAASARVRTSANTDARAKAGASMGVRAGANTSAVNTNECSVVTKSANAAKGTTKADSLSATSPKLSGAEIHKLRKLITSNEGKIETAKRKLADKLQEIEKADPTDYVTLTALQAEADEIRARIDALETEWLEASEKLDAQG